MSFGPSAAAPVAPLRVPRTGPWVAGGAAAVVLLLLAAWLLLLAPQRTTADDLRAQTEQSEANAAALTAKVAVLQAQYADLPAYQAELAALQTALPADAALPALVRSVRDAAASTGVTLTSLVPSAPTALDATADAAAATTTTTTDATTAATTATTDGAATTSTTTTSSTGLVKIPVSLSATGSYAAVQRFLAALQDGDRLFLVVSTALDPMSVEGGASQVELTLAGAVFALPADGTAVTATTTTVVATDATATATPTATASPTATAAG